MRRTALFLTAAALMVGAANLSAQGTSFAGTWTPVVDPNAGGGGRGFGGGPMTISQDAKTMTITRSMGGNDVKTVYNLDGSESKNSMMGRGGAAVESSSKATWNGATLTIVTTQDMGNGPSSTTAVYSLDASGNLVIATTRPGRNGGDPTTRTTTYKKG